MVLRERNLNFGAMKKLLIGLIIFSSCNQSVQQKAESAVKKYLKQTLNDPSSYRPELFYKVDSIFYDSTTAKHYQLDDRTLEYMRVVHLYRAKNSFGALILTIDTFKILPVDGKFFVVHFPD